MRKRNVSEQPGVPLATTESRPPRSTLGPLESRLLEWLWQRSAATTVREACAAFPSHAYTTLLTTLDRLFRKGILTRRRRGRAFAYQPRWSRTQWLGERASRIFGELLASDTARTAILSHFLSAVGREDASVLEELDAMVRAARRRIEKRETEE